jgi:hypothetical protein
MGVVTAGEHIADAYSGYHCGAPGFSELGKKFSVKFN